MYYLVSRKYGWKPERIHDFKQQGAPLTNIKHFILQDLYQIMLFLYELSAADFQFYVKYLKH